MSGQLGVSTGQRWNSRHACDSRLQRSSRQVQVPLQDWRPGRYLESGRCSSTAHRHRGRSNPHIQDCHELIAGWHFKRRARGFVLCGERTSTQRTRFSSASRCLEPEKVKDRMPDICKDRGNQRALPSVSANSRKRRSNRPSGDRLAS